MSKLTWSEVEQRIAAARQLADSHHYTVMQPQPGVNVYTVLNGNNTEYTVSFADVPTGVCDCPDFMNRGPACKHTALVVLTQWPSRFDKWQEKVRALCEPETPVEAAPPEPPAPVAAEEALVQEALAALALEQPAQGEAQPDLHTVILETVEVLVTDAVIDLLVKPLTAAIAPQVERIVRDLAAQKA